MTEVRHRGKLKTTSPHGRAGVLVAGDIAAIVAGRHSDPFAILGPHRTARGVQVRVFLPRTQTVTLTSGGTRRIMRRCDPAGFFVAMLPAGAEPPDYQLHVTTAEGFQLHHDPYAFEPVLGPLDDHLLVEGTHERLYDRLGAHPMRHQGIEGVHFALWAPNARRVSVVGDFNRWDGRCNPMRKRHDSGVWEIFIPELHAGALYKFELLGPDFGLLPLKADPFGFAAERRPATASVVARIDDFVWTDAARPAHSDWHRRPVTIYEVHLGSWQRNSDDGFVSYDELAQTLIPYAAGLGFTHLELLPITEHPLDASWGYQPIGLFAPTSRFGDPAGFARFVDRAHAAGLGVILDWVPAHFPTDIHGLARFDGTALYEYADPKRGFQPDWNTAVYDFGRREVAEILLASALFWLDRYHIDGLRADAVASMLYLDYSRPPGAWAPNPDGSNDNRDASAFLRRANSRIYARHPAAMMIAEESTAWAGVSRPVDAGGLGFGFKWNMGWMHDTLGYLGQNPVHRCWHHHKMTFGMLYAWSENFILPLSHDEVVHGKGSLVGRIQGDTWQRFATLRAYYGFMWGHPGKKLLFMGGEFAQISEWSHDRALDWQLLTAAPHRGVQALIGDLNRAYRAHPAMHARDCEAEGFGWIAADDAAASVFAWLRFAPDARPVAVLANFTPVARHGYRIGLPQPGRWREILNTDASIYGGGGLGNQGAVWAEARAWRDFPASAELLLPPLATVWLLWDPE